MLLAVILRMTLVLICWLVVSYAACSGCAIMVVVYQAEGWLLLLLMVRVVKTPTRFGFVV